MSYNSVIVTTSPTKILSSPVDGASRKSAIVTNFTILTSGTSGAVYIGFNNSVNPANGFPLNQYDIWETNEPRCYQGDLWGVAGSNIDVRYEEIL